MKKLLILGSTCKCTIQMIECAKKKGIYTITTDYLDPEEAPAKLLADEYWMINTADVDALEAKCREEKVDGVVNAISTFNAGITMELTKRLGLPCYTTPEAWHYTVDKRDFKDLCIKNGVPVAQDYYVSNPPTEEELDAIQFPVVVKAVDQSSNRGMTFCYNKEDVIKGCAYAKSVSASDKLVVERLLHGVEYTVYYALAEGESSLLALVPEFSQPGYPGSCYSLMTSAANHLDYYTEHVEPQVKRFLKEAGCREGFCWIQMYRDDDGQFYAIEMGYRMPGDMYAIPLKEAFGFDAVEWLVDIAMGKKNTVEDLPISIRHVDRKCACSYILWSKQAGILDRYIGLEEISSIPGVQIFQDIKPGESFDQYEYMLVFTFVASDYQHMLKLVDKINHTVQALDHNGENAAIYFDDFDAVRRIAEAGLRER